MFDSSTRYMPSALPAPADLPFFRERLRARQRLVGTFVKTPASQIVEILGTTGLDFVVIDAEHAPFDRAAIDLCVLAARAARIQALVRVPDATDATLLNALDVGAAGVVVPHAVDADAVRNMLAATRYHDGRRGFSNSPRAGGYGTHSLAKLVRTADIEAVVICQVEDRAAVENIEELASIDAVDCLFIGRADLAVSYKASSVDAPEVANAVERICSACAASGKAVGVFLADPSEVEAFSNRGVTLFVIGSDQSMLRAQAQSLINKLAVKRDSRPSKNQG